MAVVNLSKGQRVDLSKQVPGLKKVMVGLGWDPVTAESYRTVSDETEKKGKGLLSKLIKGHNTEKVEIPKGLRSSFDLDASVIMLQGDKFKSSNDLVYYGNLNHKSKSIRHMGDNLTGDGDGDDEEIFIDLENVPREYNKLIIVVTIYSAKQKEQSFGLINNSFIRLVDESTGKEICKYADEKIKVEEASATTLIFGELERVNNSWEFHAVGTGNTDGSIRETCEHYI